MTIMFWKGTRLACALACALLLGGVAAAQDGGPEGETADGAAPAAESPAITFLRQVEEHNAEVTSLRGRFTQVRVNPMFLEEIESEGEFWYRKPNQFRCDYFTPIESRFYLLGREGLYYTPEYNQLEVFRLRGGDSAPINQMLVGFGVKTEKILEVFRVAEAPEANRSDSEYTLRFISKDLERSLDFREITVTFDKNRLEPLRLVMQEEQDTVEVTLTETERNAEIPGEKFAKSFPPDVEVIEH